MVIAMGNLFVFISIVPIFIILLLVSDYLINKIWKKFISHYQFNKEQNLHRELTDLEQEAFQAYNALMRESMKVAEEDYHKRREELTKNEENNRKEVNACE